jgi:hypothetical protein
MSAINATAGLAVGTDAINATTFASSNAAGAALNARNSATVGEVQQSLAAANLAGRAMASGRATSVG